MGDMKCISCKSINSAIMNWDSGNTKEKRSKDKNDGLFWLMARSKMKSSGLGNPRIIFICSGVYELKYLRYMGFHLQTRFQLPTCFHSNCSPNRTSWCISFDMGHVVLILKWLNKNTYALNRFSPTIISFLSPFIRRYSRFFFHTFLVSAKNFIW